MMEQLLSSEKMYHIMKIAAIRNYFQAVTITVEEKAIELGIYAAYFPP